MYRECKNCQRYIADICSGVIPSMRAYDCENFCYSTIQVDVLVKATEALCEVAECDPSFVEKVNAALEPFQYGG